MQSFDNKEFMQWAKDKKLSFISQVSWPNAISLLPADEVATKVATSAEATSNTMSNANLYINPKKELFLTINITSDGNASNSLILVFKQLTVLK
jgi:hypothetical protein